MKNRTVFLQLAIGAMLVIGSTTPCNAQLLDRIKERVKNTAEDHVVNDAGNATDKAIDKAEDKAGKAARKKDRKGDAEAKDNGGNTPSDSQAGGTAQTAASFHSYQNYDFVPGDTILFSDDFSEDQDGEFPAHWDLTDGQAVVNKVQEKPAFCFTDGNYCRVHPLMKTATYLSDPFTIEFDTYTDGQGNESPILFLGYTSAEAGDGEGQVAFERGDDMGRGEVDISGFPHPDLSANLPADLVNNYVNKWHHCAVICKNGQMKCYVDQYRVLVVPNLGCTPVSFGFGGIGDMEHPVMISNVRAASGGSMNSIGKKFTASKIVTHGINFDVDKATLRPESMGTLNMIVKVMNDNPELKFEVDGHTDNTGDAAHNMALSQQRADAVEKQLERMGISASRLSAKGFGASKPIDSNDTQAGRANNRRVEFVRM
jgi:outer membrane protein OmpA-like peptidoglycan-associated protein